MTGILNPYQAPQIDHDRAEPGLPPVQKATKQDRLRQLAWWARQRNLMINPYLLPLLALCAGLSILLWADNYKTLLFLSNIAVFLENNMGRAIVWWFAILVFGSFLVSWIWSWFVVRLVWLELDPVPAVLLLVVGTFYFPLTLLVGFYYHHQLTSRFQRIGITGTPFRLKLPADFLRLEEKALIKKLNTFHNRSNSYRPAPDFS